MMFGTILFCTVAMTVKSILEANDLRLLHASVLNRNPNPKSVAFDVTSFMSIYVLFYNVSVLGVIMLYAYLCEHHPPYPHGEKSYDRDQFFFLTALLIVVSICTLKKNGDHPIVPSTSSHGATNHNKDVSATSISTSSNPATTTTTVSVSSLWRSTLQSWQVEQQISPVYETNEILNRDQTEEWKGWMQFMFLLYHYYKAEEVYNIIRIMITCYVWMTGFGNFSFFYIKNDYSAVRVLQMIWRLNFLVIVLCLTQGTTYILYYICLLHTYYFLMVYCTMRVAKHINYTKYGIRIKLMILSFIIFLVWDVDTGIFQFIHAPFLNSTRPMVGATSGSMWEWYFRSSLDHWSTFLGMIFALNFPITSYFIRAVEAQPLLYHIGVKMMMGVLFLLATYAWVTGPFQLNKFDYNQTNAYFGIVPVLSYIYFRNITPWLRNHTLDLLHQIGKTTLETYLMQHHIWLTSNAKSLLILIPGWPMINFLLVSLLYVAVSRRLYTMTLFLRGMILPNNLTSCLYNMLGMAIYIGSLFGIAFAMDFIGILNFTTAAIFSIIFGVILYNTVITYTWSTFVTDTTSTQNTSNVLATSMVSPLMGALAITLIGIICHLIGRSGAGTIQPLTVNCQNAVQQMKWFNIDGCNEISRGTSYRDYDIGSMGTCSASTWGWDVTQSSQYCRFVHRDPKTFQKTLQHRNITFVGDSVIRHLYHASCRQLGDVSAGAYNTSMEKWSDFSKQYGKNVKMEFRWAPYVTNLTDVVDAIEAESDKPDLLVLGGGAWDRLHTYLSDSDQDALHYAVSSLAQKLKRLNTEMPIAWVVPTTINSWALTSEAKKENIREDQIETFRELYRESGIHDAVTFVLDGPSFTSQRVAESYDGVHYPLDIYDAGAQILANAMDWLLLEINQDDPFVPPKTGSMDNPMLGILMLIFLFVGIFAFDGYLGVSYIATVLLPKVAPYRLYNITFRALHVRAGLPAVSMNGGTTNGSSTEMTQTAVPHQHLSDREDDSLGHDETELFLNKQ